MFPSFIHIPMASDDSQGYIPLELALRIMECDDGFFSAFIHALEEEHKNEQREHKHECKCHCKQSKLSDKNELKTVKKTGYVKSSRKPGDIGLRNVIFDGNKTIAFWDDGTQTVSIRWSGESNDPEKGVMAAMLKHYIGDEVCLVDEIRHWIRVGNRATEKRAARQRKEKK